MIESLALQGVGAPLYRGWVSRVGAGFERIIGEQQLSASLGIARRCVEEVYRSAGKPAEP